VTSYHRKEQPITVTNISGLNIALSLISSPRKRFSKVRGCSAEVQEKKEMEPEKNSGERLNRYRLSGGDPYRPLLTAPPRRKSSQAPPKFIIL
jgi:hypothetical protein